MHPFRHLYIHIPFCSAKCGYCAFYSLVGNHPDHRQHFLKKLSKDLQKHTENLQQLHTIFIGGGTPSLLTAHELQKLLSDIRTHTNFSPESTHEFSIENNPESITTDKIQIMAAHNINRISIGIQSFQPKLRKNLQRIGTLKNLDKTIGTLQDNHLTNLNFDLIYAIPEQTIKDLTHDLNEAIQYPITHISAYSLTIEERTTLANQKTTINNDIAVDMWHLIGNFLQERASIQRYEISNYAKSNHQCQHNHNIWLGDTYLGLGPAATSFDGTNRWQEPASLVNWLTNQKPDIDRITPEERAKEILIMGLRTVNGWTPELFQQKTGHDYHTLCSEQLTHLAANNLLQITTNKLNPTSKGLLFADYIGTQLI